MSTFVPVNEPDLSGNEERYLLECIRDGWISSDGPFVAKFEQAFAASCGRKFGIAVANGSVAIDAAVTALDISSGDEVILPTFTIISCPAQIVRAGAVPVFVDCDPNTWNLRAEDIERKITARTKAIMVVHIYGLPCDMDPILALAKKHGLKVIEDAAEMHGQTYKGRPCGSLGDLSTFSFYANKHVTSGEGGMIVTDDPDLAERCRSLRNLCFQPTKRRFVHEELGWNFRMTNMQAGLGLAQLERLPQFIERKRKMGRVYRDRLAGLRSFEYQTVETPFAENAYWVFGMVLKDSVAYDADEAMKRLAAVGVGTRPFFWPMHEQPVFKRYPWFQPESHPVAERIARRGFYLPSGLGLKDEQQAYVCEQVLKIFE